jgi:formylglycine-generating enzyme required for sulfatase activity
MGMTASEWRSIQRLDVVGALAGSPEIHATAVPAHRVTIKPFLCARFPVRRAEAAALDIAWERTVRPHYEGANPPVALTAKEVCDLLSQTRARLVSESEFEFVAREGGGKSWIVEPTTQWESPYLEALTARPEPADEERAGNRFGVWGLEFGEWVADAWHDDYVRAPESSEPWGRPARPETARSGALGLYPWQVGSEYAMCHAAVRFPAGPSSCWHVRLAWDVSA